ncbi:MAG: hypothetical protein AB1847_17880 [bacterium]
MLKNITFSTDEHLIQKAREVARKEHKSLNTVFQEWLKRYAGEENIIEDYQALMERLVYAQPGKKFTRDELNER